MTRGGLDKHWRDELSPDEAKNRYWLQRLLMANGFTLAEALTAVQQGKAEELLDQLATDTTTTEENR